MRNQFIYIYTKRWLIYGLPLHTHHKQKWLEWVSLQVGIQTSHLFSPMRAELFEVGYVVRYKLWKTYATAHYRYGNMTEATLYYKWHNLTTSDWTRIFIFINDNVRLHRGRLITPSYRGSSKSSFTNIITRS